MHMSSSYEFKKKKKREEREKQQGRISTYNAQKSFGVKKDLTPPKTLQLHHIFWKQKGLIQSRGDVTPNVPIEVPD